MRKSRTCECRVSAWKNHCCASGTARKPTHSCQLSPPSWEQKTIAGSLPTYTVWASWGCTKTLFAYVFSQDHREGPIAPRARIVADQEGIAADHGQGMTDEFGQCRGVGPGGHIGDL